MIQRNTIPRGGSLQSISLPLLILALTAGVIRGAIIYVDASVAGSLNTGTNWANAFTNLPSALVAAASNDQVWVAQGTYYPTNSTDRTASFQSTGGVFLYGGFTNGMSTLSDRNWIAHETVLSGDIGLSDVSTDNCYRVVTASDNVTIDGFTITKGVSDPPATGGGAGIFMSSKQNVAVLNCIIRDNTDYGYGAGLSAGAFSSVTVSNCQFINNQSTNATGGGMYCERTIVNVKNSVFRGNRTTKDVKAGGGLYLCDFCTSRVENCIFARNDCTWTGGGIMISRASTTLVSNCLIADNYSYQSGGGIGTYPPGSVTIENCVFVGNIDAAGYGGGFGDAGGYFRNCLFAGNYSSSYGGLYCSGIVENCTIVGNFAVGGQGGIGWAGGLNRLRNSIVWTNAGLEITGAGTQYVACANIEGGLSGSQVTLVTSVDEGGNLNTNPVFALIATGSWTAASGYNTNTHQTLLTDSGAAWGPNALAGRTVNPATTQWRQFYIVSNATTTLTVWGDASALGSNGAAYRVCDYRLARGSPCIDAGTNLAWMAGATDLDGRRRLDRASGRSDIGAYEFIRPITIVQTY